MDTQTFIAFCFSLGAIVLGAWALFWLVGKLPAKVSDNVKNIAYVVIVVLAALLVVALLTGWNTLSLP